MKALCTILLQSETIVPATSNVGGGRIQTGGVELGRRLLLAARAGDTATVLDLMAKGAPFTTDWVRILEHFKLCYI